METEDSLIKKISVLESSVDRLAQQIRTSVSSEVRLAYQELFKENAKRLEELRCLYDEIKEESAPDEPTAATNGLPVRTTETPRMLAPTKHRAKMSMGTVSEFLLARTSC
jgi:hypothetical protein